MKKSDLLKMDRLAATPNMMRLAQNDKPVIQVCTYARTSREKYKHDLYIRCRIQNGILKVALFWTAFMRCMFPEKKENLSPTTVSMKNG